jgi:micrococcal nuclease
VIYLAVVALLASLACGPTGAEQAGPPPAPIVERAAPPAPRPAPVTTPAATLRVRHVIDGDTITVSGIGTVRLIGVDAPEKTGGYRESEPYGDEATRFMKVLVGDKLVRLEYEGERKDQYDRTLAYVFLEDGTLANEAIIRAGLAETYRRFAYSRKADFQAAEREAKEARRGMWARATAPRRR